MPKVTTKHVTIYSPEGSRLKDAVWSRARVWRKYKDTLGNLKQAITFAREVMDRKQIGTVVYVGDTPVYHTKWGGGRAFYGWKSNPVAEWWRRRVGIRG